MHLGRILPQARCHHMFGLFDGDTINVVNDFTQLIVDPAMWFARQREIIV